MRIAIVTHRRRDILKENTLAWLQKTDIKTKNMVDLFVSDAQDAVDYEGLPVARIIVTGAANLAEKFNYVHMFYPIGERVFCMEDDITLMVKSEPKCKVFTTKVRDWLSYAFGGIQTGGIFGIVPHDNAYFMKAQPTTSLKLCVANAFGFVSTQDERLLVRHSHKNDYERTILYWNMYGRVVRYNDIGVKTKNYKNSGGFNSQYGKDKRLRLEEEAVTYLCDRYAHLISRNTKKDSVYPEMKLKHIRQKPNEVIDWASLQAMYDRQKGYR